MEKRRRRKCAIASYMREKRKELSKHIHKVFFIHKAIPSKPTLHDLYNILTTPSKKGSFTHQTFIATDGALAQIVGKEKVPLAKKAHSLFAVKAVRLSGSLLPRLFVETFSKGPRDSSQV